MTQQPPMSPSFRPGFLRRHHKSNSSESSLIYMNMQSNSVTSLLEPTEDHVSYKDLKVNILDQPEHRKNKGIFKKFRIRDRSKSRDNLRVDSPTSPLYDVSHQKHPTNATNEKYLSLDARYRPQKGPDSSQQVILITSDNKTFTTILIPDLSSVAEVKSAIATQFNLNSSNMDIHLTEFGCSKGEPLEDSMLHDLLFTSFPQQWSDCVKLFISPVASSLLPVSRRSGSSLSLNALSPQGDSAQYPNTPAYMLNDSGNNPSNDDYFSTNRLQVPESSSRAAAKNHISPNSSTSTVALSSNPTVTLSDSSGATSRPVAISDTSTSRKSSDDSFKVIRTARREINFDDRRPSPYERKTSSNLVALREAPPPPVSRSQSVKSVASLKRQGTRDKNKPVTGKSTTPPKTAAGTPPPTTKVTVNTKDVPPNNSLKTYSPGQSENLIPMPYVGNTQQNAVARKPVRRGSDSSRNSRSPNSLLTMNSSLSSPSVSNTNNDGTLVPIFKMPEFGRSSPLGPLPDKSMGPDEKFHENEISFDDAPAFVDGDDDDSSDDDGLWAKKPPKIIEPKPELHVETTTPVSNTPMWSPATPYKSASSTASPVRIVDENGESWAVRPPAEVVYENLERFFPNADLDKPIIDDLPLSPIMSSVEADSATITKSTPVPMVVEPKESPVQQQASKAWRMQPPKTREQRIDRNSSTLRPSAGSRSTSSGTSSGTVAGGAKLPTAANLRAPSRMKSLRIVAREASEARKRFSSANSSSSQTGAALLRRKSTKMWGQKVVEMKPNEIRDGNLSTLRDQKGEFKQFVWVKGELIGKGTFGKVYLALNATTGEMMAVKQVEVPQTISDKESERQKEVVGALHSEVETLKDLDHLNIVQYLGFEALPDVYNLFLEYVPGGSVGRCLRMYGRFEEPIIKSLTHQVLDGLSYLHSCGILHRVRFGLLQQVSRCCHFACRKEINILT